MRIPTFIFTALAAFLFFSLHSPAWADPQKDFEEGLAAYKEKDFSKAFRLWQPIAKKGFPKAQFNLAILYIDGLGAPKDLKKAVEWFRKAAEQDHTGAQYNLGLMYLNGEGTQKSNKEALKWLRKAAEKGDPLAQYSLAGMYIYGKGVKKDYVKAHMWSNLASQRGLKEAEQARDDIARNLTPEQLINARLLAREWKPKLPQKEKKVTKKEF